MMPRHSLVVSLLIMLVTVVSGWSAISGHFASHEPAVMPAPTFSVPSQLTVLEVDGETILALAWAQSDSALDDWLPVAEEIIDSIDFDAE